MHKQDRQGSRTPAALERKYGFGRRFQDQEQANREQDTQTAAVAQALEAHVRNSDTALEQVARELTQLKTGLSSLERRYTGFREDMERSLGVINDTVAALLGALTPLQQTAAALSAAVSRQAEQLALLETRIVYQDGRLDAIDAALEALGTQ